MGVTGLFKMAVAVSCKEKAGFPLNSPGSQYIAFLCANNRSIYVLLTITSNRNGIITIKKAHKMSLMYFKGGSVYFHLCFLVGKTFNVTTWRKHGVKTSSSSSRRKKIGNSFLIFPSSKLDFIIR